MSLVLLIILAGWGQLALVAASFAIPRALGWRSELTRVRPLIRQMFWTYAGYILGTNLCFGLLSILGPRLLLDRSPLAAAVTGYMALYWIARVLVQFLYFDRSDAPRGRVFLLLEAALVALFVFLAFVYGCAVTLNLQGLGR